MKGGALSEQISFSFFLFFFLLGMIDKPFSSLQDKLQLNASTAASLTLQFVSPTNKKKDPTTVHVLAPTSAH